VELTPSEVGARAERAVAFALATAGKRVYLPLFAPHSRVDLVFEDETGFHRVQCKTSRLNGAVVSFCTCSNTKDVRKSYQGEADLFGVYSPELDQVFLVPVADVPERACSLRLAPTRNRQAKGIRWAHDYLLAKPDVNASPPRLFAA
jgi:hypothetical protein